MIEIFLMILIFIVGIINIFGFSMKIELDFEQYLTFILGISTGLIIATCLVNMTSSGYTKKENLLNKKTITMDNYFVQYSAVRRFSK